MAGVRGKRKAAAPTRKTANSRNARNTRPAKNGNGGKKGNNGKRPPKKPLTRWGKVRRVLLWLTVVGLVMTLLGVGALAILYRTTDLPDPNKDFQTQTSFVYYADEKTQIGQYAVQNRVRLGYDEIPQSVKDAVVAAENRSFWTDKGIDPKGILRALFSNAQGNATQGASTITQQYIKILYLTQERSYSRKLKEALLAIKLVRQRSKEEILDGYLNTIYFGRGAYGVQAASLAYFNKDAQELTLREAAVLASVINNPSRFDPANGKDAKQALRERYAYVLDGMAQADMVSAAEAEEAARRLPKFHRPEADNTYGGQRGHVLKMVRDALLKLTDENGDPLLTDDEIDGGGLRVTTTFTKKAMDAAEQGVLEARPEGFSDKELHVGVASVEPGTGAVRGIYGGQDFLQSQINWAVAGGQAGSSLKPFALAAGLKDGYSLRDTFEGNSPIELPDGTDIENQGDQDYGSAVNLITATENSINTAFTDLMMSMEEGPEKTLKMMNAMGIPPKKARPSHPYGIPDNTPALEPVIGLPLGSATVSPINMANGYATIANGGRMADPYIIEKVVNADGETIYDHQVSDRAAIAPDDAELNTDIAADVSYALQQVVSSGSGTAALGLGRPAAGKTGTSTNDVGDVVSAWFTGYTPQLATSVVYLRGKGVGKLDGWLPSYFGGDYPAETWTAVMTRAMDGVEVEDFPPPAYVDGEAPESGHAPTTPPPTKPPSPPPSETQTEGPTETQEPTSEPPTPAPPTTSAPPPPPSPPPTTDCNVVICPSDSPPPSPSDTTSPSGGTSASPRTAPGGRTVLVADRRTWW